MLREDIRLAIRNIRNLPTLPAVVLRIMEVAQDRESSAKQLAEIVSNDQSVFARVLKLANSAFYGFSRQISNITQAVVVLGFDTVRSLALSVSTFDSLSRADSESRFDREGFWVHSIGAGMAARAIGGAMGSCDSGNLFVAGLLHDVGKVILDSHFREYYGIAVERLMVERRPTVEVEREVLDIDHAEVGGWIAARWRFPDALVAPIAHHHRPEAADWTGLEQTLIVHLANILVKRMKIGLCYEATAPEPSELVYSRLGLKPDVLPQVMEELDGAREEIDEFFMYLKG